MFGKVYLVGAGPGEPGLITIRGVECLQKANLVLYDYLVNPVLLDHAPATAERVCLGHHHAGREFSQEEINERMIEAAGQGKLVVRLKGGDPAVFGRGAEETAALTAAGIPYEIVPGVTAALAAAGYAEIPITHGQRASAVALVTGHQRPDKSDPLDYGVLADFPGTLIFYMGIRSADRWSKALLERGKSPKTSVAIVRRCTFADQEIVRCTLGAVVEVIEEKKLHPPAVIVVGEVIDFAPVASWFAKRPLAGQTVMVTRPGGDVLSVHPEILPSPFGRGAGGEGDAIFNAATLTLDLSRPTDHAPHGARRCPERGLNRDDILTTQLRELGANVIEHPVVYISDPSDWRPVDAVLNRIDQFNWIVFSSANGVRYFLGRLFTIGGDLRRLGSVKLAAMGPATAEELLRHHLRADVIPTEFRAESLAESLAGEASGKHYLLVRASRGREVLAEQLNRAGGSVEQVVAYTSSDVEQPDPKIAAMLAAGGIDWITVTSSSIARSLVNLFGDKLRQTKIASLSPVTSATLKELGLEPAVEAAEYTMPGLVEAIRHAAEKYSGGR